MGIRDPVLAIFDPLEPRLMLIDTLFLVIAGVAYLPALRIAMKELAWAGRLRLGA